MKEDFGGKPFGLLHYLAIESARQCNNPDTIYFHYQYEPEGEFWDMAKPHLKLNKIIAPTEIYGNKLYHVAHQSDIVRLEMLRDIGGIYMDLDTISKKPLHEFRTEKFVIGQEFTPQVHFSVLKKIMKCFTRRSLYPILNPKISGLCNAIMMSEKNSDFINLWLESYKTFRSKGRDEFWAEHSIIMPLELSKRYPETLCVLGPYHFHYPIYDEKSMDMLFNKTIDFKEAYVHHLWESYTWDIYFKDLTINTIKSTDNSYNIIARNYI
jgi:hypothetical protein